jgi:hypothetical protein
LAEGLKPPELPNFSEAATLTADNGPKTPAEATDIAATGPAVPAIAPPDAVGHDIVAPKP